MKLLVDAQLQLPRRLALRLQTLGHDALRANPIYQHPCGQVSAR
jgi:predicted nuclease of predicted toxin-antitoxin system